MSALHCRHCRELLSAYLDSELDGDQMDQVREHLGVCPSCLREYQALQETKCALASLGARVSRDEIERLLQTDVSEAVRRYAAMPVSPRTVAAAILSILGVCWVASSRLATSDAEHAAPLPEGVYLFPVTVSTYRGINSHGEMVVTTTPALMAIPGPSPDYLERPRVPSSSSASLVSSMPPSALIAPTVWGHSHRPEPTWIQAASFGH